MRPLGWGSGFDPGCVKTGRALEFSHGQDLIADPWFRNSISLHRFVRGLHKKCLRSGAGGVNAL
jgi:hypothetical protein